MVQNKCKSPSYKTRKKKPVPKEQWIRVENTHEAIISKETWELSQEIGKLKTKSVNEENKTGIFAGKMICLDCEKAMVRQYHRTGGCIGYCCKTYKGHGNKFCTSHFISNEDLEYSVLTAIKNEAKNALTQKDIDSVNINELVPKNKDNINHIIQNLESQLINIDNYKKKSYENFIDGILTKDEFLQYKEDYTKQEEDVAGQINALKEQIENKKLINNKYNSWIDNFIKYIDIEKLDRNVIVELVDWIKVTKDGHIDINFKFENPYK